MGAKVSDGAIEIFKNFVAEMARNTRNLSPTWDTSDLATDRWRRSMILQLHRERVEVQSSCIQRNAEMKPSPPSSLGRKNLVRKE